MSSYITFIGKRVSYYNMYRGGVAYGIVVSIDAATGVAIVRGNGLQHSPYQYNAPITTLKIISNR